MREQIAAILDKSRAYQALNREVEALLLAKARGGNSVAARLLALLTRREREILALIGRACSSRQIREQVHITQRTVETHRHNIWCKLGLSGASLERQATHLDQAHVLPRDPEDLRRTRPYQ